MPAATTIDCSSWPIWPASTATVVTATMIGSPVALKSPSVSRPAAPRWRKTA